MKAAVFGHGNAQCSKASLRQQKTFLRHLLHPKMPKVVITRQAGDSFSRSRCPHNRILVVTTEARARCYVTMETVLHPDRLDVEKGTFLAYVACCWNVWREKSAMV